MENPRNHVDFHYIKDHGYQTHFADGAYGGVTPKGGLFISFYAERTPIPTITRIEINEKGEATPETRCEGKVGIIREVSCGVIISMETAKDLRGWLDKTIAMAEQLKPK